MFKLHPTLEKDLIEICDLNLSKLMLLPDTENPWVVLVPRVNDIRELHELKHEHQLELLNEINKLSLFLDNKFTPQKLNIGALGNMVPQLHIHIIVRYQGDRAWPGAIWGTNSKIETYNINSLESILKDEFLKK